jgi:uptake hydrogenase large subunit
MTLEGELVVHLPWNGHHVQRVRLHSSRPIAASRALAGKPPDEVVATVPLLFSICGGAQRAAASGALAAAAGGRCSGTSDELRVILETVQEYFWRLLIDWPKAMGRERLAGPVAAVRQQIAATARAANGSPEWEPATATGELGATIGALATKCIYGISPGVWLSFGDSAALQTWIDRGATLPAVLLGELMRQMPDVGRSDVALMPTATPDALVAAVVPALGEPQFARTPTWDGVPVETGALARMCSQPVVAAQAARHGNAVATRMVARLAELATLLQELASGRPEADAPARIQTLALAPGDGLAAVQTARGLLLHRARLADGKVSDYQIVAPTEWNFHPDGALVRGLCGLAADDEMELEQRARVAVQALDPCVACRIEVGHA